MSSRVEIPFAPRAFERAAAKSLQKDPDARWQSAADLASELTWIAESGPADAGAPATRRRRHTELWGWIAAGTRYRRSRREKAGGGDLRRGICFACIDRRNRQRAARKIGLFGRYSELLLASIRGGGR